MNPYYEDDAVTIYHGDCREIVDTISPDLALVSDPPYGMAWDTDTTRFSGGSVASAARRGVGTVRPPVAGDKEPFDPRPFIGFPEVILFGCNHFGELLPRGTTLVWIKRSDTGFGSFLSDAELAWMKGGHGVYCFRDLSMAAIARSRSHPSQKPVSLMSWCVSKTSNETVLDPFMGSGTTLVAAKNLGRKAIGIEIEEKYCEIAALRCSQEVLAL